MDGYNVSVGHRVNMMTARLVMDAWLILIVIYVYFTMNFFNFLSAIHFCKMYFVVTAVGVIVICDALVL